MIDKNKNTVNLSISTKLTLIVSVTLCFALPILSFYRNFPQLNSTHCFHYILNMCLYLQGKNNLMSYKDNTNK